MKITIQKTKNADTRSCDFSKVTSEVLLKNSEQHIEDVQRGLIFLINLMTKAAQFHDITKITHINQFHKDFINGFKEGNTSWWEMHQSFERHHLKNEKYVQEDVNLIDILEMVVDGVMAGLARTGEYRKEEIPDTLLRKAFDNTIKLLLDNVVVEDNE